MQAKPDLSSCPSASIVIHAVPYIINIASYGKCKPLASVNAVFCRKEAEHPAWAAIALIGMVNVDIVGFMIVKAAMNKGIDGR